MKREAHGLNVMNRMSLGDYRREVGLAGSLNDVNPLGPLMQRESGERLKAFGKQPEPKPRKKFGNKRTTYDSPLVGEMKYPSEGQAERAKELDLLWRGGEILWWMPEITIRLKAHTGTRQRTMRVDFLICWKDGTVTWQDYKRVLTEAWSLKRDLVREQYGIEIETV